MTSSCNEGGYDALIAYGEAERLGDALSNVDIWALALHPLRQGLGAQRLNLPYNSSLVHDVRRGLTNEFSNVHLETVSAR